MLSVYIESALIVCVVYNYGVYVCMCESTWLVYVCTYVKLCMQFVCVVRVCVFVCMYTCVKMFSKLSLSRMYS